MRLFTYFTLLVLLNVSCNSTKNATTEISAKKTAWTEVSKTEIPEKYALYKVYHLDSESFRHALKNGLIFLPNNLGEINSFSIKESQTMSPELAAKFPNIKTYKGFQDNNTLCNTRIETNKSKIKIAVFCNDKTYFIDKDKDLNIYIVYTKENAPKGVGLIKE